MRKQLLFFTLSFLLFPFFSISQTLLWEQNYGGSNEERAYDIIPTYDGNYVIAGWTGSSNNDVSSNNGNHDYWVAKITPSGTLLWEETYGGSGNDYAYTIRETNDKGFIVAGNTSSSSGDVGGNNGQYDTWIVKLDSIGGIEWEQNYGGSDYDFGDYIEQTADGGYIFLANSGSSDGDVGGNYGNRDIWIVKINATGTIQWEQNYGGSDYDYPCAIRQLPGGNYIVSGRTRSTDNDVSSIYGSYDTWAFKINSTGTLLWEKTFGGTSGELTNSMELTSDYKVLICGRSTSNDNDLPGNYGNADFWVVKMDTSGNIAWSGNYGGSSFDEAHSVREAPDGNYIIAGSSQSTDNDASANYGTYDFWALKLTSSGTVQWEQNFGGTIDDIAYSVIPTSSGGYMLAGRSESGDNDVSGNYGDFDYWVINIDDTLINTGIDTRSLAAESAVSVFPNPSDGDFTVDIGEREITALKVMDTRGRKVFEARPGKTGNGKFSVQIPDVKAGLYYLVLEEKGSLTGRKILIEE